MEKYMFMLLGVILGVAISLYIYGEKRERYARRIKSDREYFSTKRLDEALDKGFTYEEIWGGVDRDGNIVSVNGTRMREAQEIAPTYEVLKTDKDGNAYTQKKLPYGRYICKETRTPVDYESAQDFTFSITQDESEIHETSKKVKDIVVNDEQLETYIRLIKRDTKTGKNVSLNSATFQIYATEDIYDRATGLILHQRGYPIHQKLGGTIFDSFTTNSDNLIVPNNSFADRQQNKGTVIVPLKLEVGGYEIREITTPEGFLPLEKPIKFRVENVRNYDVDEDEDFIQEIVISNEQPTGELRLDKFVALRNGDLLKDDHAGGCVLYEKLEQVKNIMKS